MHQQTASEDKEGRGEEEGAGRGKKRGGEGGGRGGVGAREAVASAFTRTFSFD